MKFSLATIFISIFLLMGFSILIFNSFEGELNPTGNQISEENDIIIEETLHEPSLYEVVINNFQFSPKELKIKKGDTVRWINLDISKHTITLEDLDSQDLMRGGDYYFTFNEIGEYNYYCTYHPYMNGKIIVE